MLDTELLTQVLAAPEMLDTPILERLRSLLGMGVLIGIAWALSTDRRRISWSLVAWGLALQFVFAVFILKTSVGAGLFDAAETVDITRESYERLYAVNVAGTLFTMQAAARQMIAQGHGGKIINMASQAGRRGESLVLVYCSTKAAVISMTQSAGLNLIKYGINVNAIAPGVVDGAHWEHVDSLFAKLEGKELGQKKAEVEAGVPAGRFAVPADLTGMAVFLASAEADYIVSQTYNVDGGQWMS